MNRANAPPLGVAASVLVRDVVAGPLRPATVVAAGAAASYLDVGGRLLAVVQQGGVRLPCAVVVRDTSSLLTSPTPRPGGGAPPDAGGLAVGAGAIRRDGRPVLAVGRWFDPRVRVSRVDPGARARFATLVRSQGQVDPLLPDDAIERLADGLAADHEHGAVAALLGLGTGLTPAGDDLLAGALAALRALGSPAAHGLGTAVRTMAPVATTRLSAALLEAADMGAVVPEAAAVLRALAGVGTGSLDAATRRLVGLGHTSGWHLAAGLLLGVTRAERHALARAGSAR
ncbi:MAG: DUF2877 domain-containing protein [Acidimicrobiales bacterium]